MDIAMIGLGKMGAFMTERLLNGGHRVVGYDHNPEAVARVVAKGAVGAASLPEAVAALEPARIVWMMVAAGDPVDQTIAALMPLLHAGDILIDGGNSYYKDSIREITPNSNNKFWWKCKNNHEWEATPSSRTSGTGCPFCYGRYASDENNLAVIYPESLEQWDYELNKTLDPSKLTAHVSKKAWWKCPRNHSYQATVYNRTKNKSGPALPTHQCKKVQN